MPRLSVKGLMFFARKGTFQRESYVKYEEFLCDFVIGRGKAVCMQDIPSLLEEFYTVLAVR